MALEKIDEVSKITKGSKSAAAQDVADSQPLERLPPNKEHFDNLMDTRHAETATSKATPESIEPITKSSIMDEVRNLNQRVDRFSTINPKELVTQADEVINHIESIKQKLAASNVEIKPGTQTLLHNKLLHIDENLRVALSKAGVEYTPPVHTESKLVNPMDRFLGFLTHGQEQLKTLSHEVDLMHLNRKEISPANMLRIQIKVGYIQQEIEFFSAVLNKALESTKTIMNVQV
jgi:DNA-directed RNA polymerase subunit F